MQIKQKELVYENSDKFCILTLDGPKIQTSPMNLGKKMITPLLRESSKFVNMQIRDGIRARDDFRNKKPLSPPNQLLRSVLTDSNGSNGEIDSVRKQLQTRSSVNRSNGQVKVGRSITDANTGKSFLLNAEQLA